MGITAMGIQRHQQYKSSSRGPCSSRSQVYNSGSSSNGSSKKGIKNSSSGSVWLAS
jgi:hypothetical protein